MAIRMRSIPNLGMRTKPASRLPVMLPSVDQKKTSPAILPTPVAGDQATIRLSTPSGFTVKANFWTNELSTTCTITGTAIGG